MKNILEKAFEKVNIGGKTFWLSKAFNIVLVLEDHRTGIKRWIIGHNIVTTAGNVYYAQEVSIGFLGSGTPTNVFAQLYLSTAGPATPAVTDTYASFNSGQTAGKALTSTYPKANDGDSDNTGAGTTVLTWAYAYTTGDGPYTAIQWCFIAKAAASGTDPILNSYKWTSSWNKDSSTSAKVFVNHTFLGS